MTTQYQLVVSPVGGRPLCTYLVLLEVDLPVAFDPGIEGGAAGELSHSEVRVLLDGLGLLRHQRDRVHQEEGPLPALRPRPDGYRARKEHATNTDRTWPEGYRARTKHIQNTETARQDWGGGSNQQRHC